jgi:hypothetical protein
MRLRGYDGKHGGVDALVGLYCILSLMIPVRF